MNQGKYVFSQITDFIPKRQFERMAAEYKDRTNGWEVTPWNQLMVLMYGQLEGCCSLRELTDLTTAHGSKSFHLGFGRLPVNKSTLSKANQLRDYRLFERFAYHMVNLAQGARVGSEFVLYGKYYAFDSSTISLGLKLFDWARFRSTKSGIKMHTQYDVVTDIPWLSVSPMPESMMSMRWTGLNTSPAPAISLTRATGISEGCSASIC